MSIENHIFCARSSAVVNTEYSCFFIPEAKGPACPASGSPWFLFCQVFGTNKQYLPVLLCLALSACSWTMQLTWSCLFFLPPWYGLLHFIYKNTLKPYNYLDRGLQLQVQEIGCLGTLRNENMSWDIERAKGWVEQRAHPTFQFTCLFEHFETLQLRTRRTSLDINITIYSIVFLAPDGLTVIFTHPVLWNHETAQFDRIHFTDEAHLHACPGTLCMGGWGCPSLGHTNWSTLLQAHHNAQCECDCPLTCPKWPIPWW